MRRWLMALALAACGRTALYETGAPRRCGDRADPSKLEVLFSDAPRPVDDAQPMAVALDATHVWWTDKTGDVRKRAKAGGAPIAVATGQDHPAALAAAGGRVFWANVRTYGSDYATRGASLMSVGGEIASGGAELDGVLDLAVTGDALVVVANAALTSIALATGRRTALGPAEIHPTAAAADGELVFWTDRQHGEVRAVNLSGEGDRLIAPATGVPWCCLAFDDDNVYWTSIDLSQGVHAVLSSAPRSGGTPTRLASEPGYPWGLAVDDGCVYWSVNDTPTAMGHVFACSTSGCGEPAELAGGALTAAALAVDATHVYFTGVLEKAGVLMRAPR